MDKKAIFRRALACLIVAATLFTLISLLSYSKLDTDWPVPAGAANWCGKIGSSLANTLLDWLGLGSYMAVALVATWGAFFLIRKRVEDLWFKTIGALLLLSAVTAALGMLPGYPEHGPGWGGQIGCYYRDLLANYCSFGGATLVIGLAAAFGLIFLGLDHYVSMAAMAGWQKIRPHVDMFLGRFRRERPPVLVHAKVIDSPAPPAVEPLAPALPQPAANEDDDAADGVPQMPLAEQAPAPAPPPESKAEKDDERRQNEARKKIEQRLSESIKRATQPLKVPKTPADHRESGEGYTLPPLDILDDPEYHDTSEAQAQIENNIAILETTLADFNIGAEVVDIDRGPVITRYELSLAPGIKVTRITSLADDIAMAVKAPSVRIVAPIPGKSTVGIEVPNASREVVRLKELVATKEYKQGKYMIPVMLGKDTSGKPIIYDLARMPHLLIAGATGSGKSVCINSILISMLMTKRPEDLQLILIDPKMVELSSFEEIPHLLCPVVTDMKRAPWILEWSTKQMDERYDMLSAVGVRHITQYNALGEEEIQKRLGPDADYDKIPFHLPYVVIIIDELADLMISSAKEVESSITRLAQKSRAVGIHIILATQRPSVDVITGLIKANMPTRIAFHVTSKVDSRTILDGNGAEKLLGSGDLLFMPPDSAGLLRLQGTYVSDQEIKRIVSAVKQNKEGGRYKLDLDNWGGLPSDEEEGGFDDELYEPACRIVLETQRGSVSLLQRKLEIGYTRASRLMDHMATEGLVGAFKGSKAREVLTTLQEWEKQHGRPEGYGPSSLSDPFDDRDDSEDLAEPSKDRE